MNDNTRKTPATFSYAANKDGKFALYIVVNNFDITTRCVLKGVIQRQLGIVVLEELETDMQEGVRWSDLFQATVLRVVSLYTSFALRKFYLAKEIVKYFSEDTITSAPNEINLPAVKVEDTLRLSKAAAEVFDVTCTNMFAVLTHDPEEVAFQESWMDTTTQMMLNAVFDIPKMWTSNINASGVVTRDEHTDWVWNYSPSTEILIIHVHDRTNKKHSQWEVTRDLAIHFTGTDRENGTHYRSFINHEGGRQWHVTRKVIVQRTYITELPAGTTKSVFKQIKHVLQSLQDTATFKFAGKTYQPNYLQWLELSMLEEAWCGADGKLPIEPPIALRMAYLRLMLHYNGTQGSNVDRIRAGAIARSVETLEALYGLLSPIFVRGESDAVRFRKFWTAFELDRDKLGKLFDEDNTSAFSLHEVLPMMYAMEAMNNWKKEVDSKESDEDETVDH